MSNSPYDWSLSPQKTFLGSRFSGLAAPAPAALRKEARECVWKTPQWSVRGSPATHSPLHASHPTILTNDCCACHVLAVPFPAPSS